MLKSRTVPNSSTLGLGILQDIRCGAQAMYTRGAAVLSDSPAPFRRSMGFAPFAVTMATAAIALLMHVVPFLPIASPSRLYFEDHLSTWIILAPKLCHAPKLTEFAKPAFQSEDSLASHPSPRRWPRRRSRFSCTWCVPFPSRQPDGFCEDSMSRLTNFAPT